VPPTVKTWEEDPLSSSNDTTTFEFGGPATYRIVIQGTVTESWHRRLGGMEVTTSNPESDRPRTILRGPLRDQAALHGLLETLYALHLPILEVAKVDPDAN
jgi:hypothetical protein